MKKAVYLIISICFCSSLIAQDISTIKEDIDCLTGITTDSAIVLITRCSYCLTGIQDELVIYYKSNNKWKARKYILSKKEKWKCAYRNRKIDDKELELFFIGLDSKPFNQEKKKLIQFNSERDRERGYSVEVNHGENWTIYIWGERHVDQSTVSLKENTIEDIRLVCPRTQSLIEYMSAF